MPRRKVERKGLQWAFSSERVLYTYPDRARLLCTTDAAFHLLAWRIETCDVCTVEIDDVLAVFIEDVEQLCVDGEATRLPRTPQIHASLGIGPDRVVFDQRILA